MVKTKKNLDIMYKFWFKPIFLYFYLLIFYSHLVNWHKVSQKANFVFVELALFEVSK